MGCALARGQTRAGTQGQNVPETAPSHALRHDAPKQGPICHAVAFSSLFACRNLVFSSILRAILHTTDIDQRPALACGVAKRDPLARRGPAHPRHGIAAKTSHASGSTRPPCPQYHLLPCFQLTVFLAYRNGTFETVHDSFTVVIPDVGSRCIRFRNTCKASLFR